VERVWEIEEQGEKSYIVPFPCKIELDRMVAIRTFTTKNNGGVLLFEEHTLEIKPLKKLQQVWVRIFGVPNEIRSFLPLWAVGSILGATQKVDMSYLRKTGVVRLLVAVLDVNAVPKDADVVVHRSMYKIFFKVDEVVRDEDDFNPEDDDLLDDDADQAKGKDMEETDQDEHNGDFDELPHEQNLSITDGYNGMSYGKQVALVEEVIDITCNRLIEDLSFKVMNEANEDLVTADTPQDQVPTAETSIASIIPVPQVTEVPVLETKLAGDGVAVLNNPVLVQGQELDATEIEAAEDGVDTANSGMSTTTDSVPRAVQDSIEL
jgi:hypothetical protein